MTGTKKYKLHAKKSVSAATRMFVVNSIVKFGIRTAIIWLLGKEMLGLDTLYTNILMVLSISELGISQAMNFTLYKPIANKEWAKLHALSNLYRKIYLIIGCAIIVIGVGIAFVLPFLLNDGVNIPHVYLIYFLYLANAAVSYLLRGKRPLLAADTRQYLQANNDTVFLILSGAIQVIALLIWQNLLAYAIVMVIFTTLSSLRMMRVSSKLYGHIDEHTPEKLDSETMQILKKTVLGTAFVKLRRLAIMHTDTILVSILFNLATVGKYGNYLIIINLARGFVTTATAPLISALAHVSAKKSPDEIKRLFIRYSLAITVLAIVVFIGFVILVNPFIRIWAGDSFVLPLSAVVWFGFSLFLNVAYHAGETFMESFGLQRYHRVISVIEVVLNIGLSILFAVPMNMGLSGIIAGTCISMLLTSFWFTPYTVWKYVLKSKQSAK